MHFRGKNKFILRGLGPALAPPAGAGDHDACLRPYQALTTVTVRFTVTVTTSKSLTVTRMNGNTKSRAWAWQEQVADSNSARESDLDRKGRGGIRI